MNETKGRKIIFDPPSVMMIMIREVQPRHNPCLSHVLSLIVLADLAVVSVGYDDTVMTAKTGNTAGTSRKTRVQTIAERFTGVKLLSCSVPTVIYSHSSRRCPVIYTTCVLKAVYTSLSS